jgi:hypothetical protein
MLLLVPSKIRAAAMDQHQELLDSIKDYLAKKDAFDKDGTPSNWNAFADADQRLAKALEASERALRHPS